MPVFGITTTDGLGEPTGPNYKNVSKFTLSESGLVNKLSLFMFAAGGTAQVRGALYADSSGSPAAFKAVGSEFTVVDGAGLAWFDSTISPSVLLAPGDYWLGFNSTGGGLRLVYHSVAGNRKYGPETYSASPSDPFGSVEATDEKEITVYATYDSVAPQFPQQLQPRRGGTGRW